MTMTLPTEYQTLATYMREAADNIDNDFVEGELSKAAATIGTINPSSALGDLHGLISIVNTAASCLSQIPTSSIQSGTLRVALCEFLEVAGNTQGAG